MRWVKASGKWGDERLPVLSEAAISFRTKTMPIGYVSRLSWNVYEQLMATDTQRQGRVAKQLQRMQEVAERDRMRVARDRWKEARKYMNWHARTHPMAA